MKRSSMVLLLAMALSPAALAGDDEAKELLKQAYARWNDPEPSESLRLAEAALAQNPTDLTVKCQIDLFIGSLHQAKTGDFDAAIEKYDRIIRATVDTKDAGLRQLKANAMVRKGTILYSQRDDAEAALRLYQSAHLAFQLSTTVDTTSQLAFRLGRDPKRSSDERQTFMDVALRAAQEAVTLAPRELRAQPEAQARNLGKCRLQLVIVLTALGRADEARAEWAKVEPATIDNDNTLYQRAVLHALRGEADQATQLMRRCLGTRPEGRDGVVPRNQLRKMIRTEPDLLPLHARPDWKELIEDEAVPGGRGS